jgi:hypothetical protein
LTKRPKEEKQMTAAIPAGETSLGGDATGASFHGVTDWHAIDWQNVNHTVRRLQARIVKATQEKRWGKVKALQRLLTHSFSGKALAVRRVTEKPGQEHPRSGQGHLEHPTQEDQRHLRASATGLPSPTPPANLHPEEKRCDPFPPNRDLTGEEERRLFRKEKTLTTNLLTLGAIPNQLDERLITHPSCSDWSSIRKAG